MNKIQKYHHSVTENGKLQLRIITEYQDDLGSVIAQKYSNPMTPADTKDMTEWDQKSKAIVDAITVQKVKSDFSIEKKEKTGTGFEEIVTFDRVIEDDEKIAVRIITRIFDEGKEVSKKYHRSWIMPGDDVTNADVMSKALAGKLHTPVIISNYKTKIGEVKL